MGCHTWIYKKVSALTEQEKTDIVAEARKDAETWWGFKLTKSEVTERLKKLYSHLVSDDYDPYHGESPEEHTDKLFKKYTEKRDRIIAEGLPAVIEYEASTAQVKYIDGQPYYHIGGDDLLRIREYPEDTFTNVDKLLEWLRSYDEDKFGYYKQNGDFKKGYTTELVDSIVRYFKKHGEDNLYVEFG